MRGTIGAIAAAVVLVGGAAAAKPMHGKAHDTTAFQVKSTSWEFTGDGGAKMQESIGPDGKYVVRSAGQHVDHGMAVMKGDKACFTSAMTKEGEVCWTTRPTAIGASMDTISDKGEKHSVTRVSYTPPTM